MATERQIAANRANAARSTGPKTATGRLRSSRNAFRHGLSSRLDMVTSAKLDAITRALIGEGAGERQSAAELAVAQLELLRIRAVRAELMREVDSNNAHRLLKLAALDRYERLAYTKRRRASYKL